MLPFRRIYYYYYPVLEIESRRRLWKRDRENGSAVRLSGCVVCGAQELEGSASVYQCGQWGACERWRRERR
jgi:hypothetical protein